MAVGVPEHDVFAVADAVLARGPRPAASGRRWNEYTWSWAAAVRRGSEGCSINGGCAWPSA